MSKSNSLLHFDPETHKYTLDGRVLPSVTTIINAILPGYQADEWYMQRGTAMHYACQLLDEGQLDWSTVAPEIEGRVRAWEQFRKDFPGTVKEVEHAMAHDYGFAGMMDRLFSRTTGTLLLADIKSSLAPQVRLQLGAYAILYNDATHNARRPIREACAVQLCDDGKYKTLWMKESELALAGRTFLACLSVYGFKHKENLK